MLGFARIAATAEGVKFKAMARRQARRGFYAAVAALFGLFVVIMLHLTAYGFLAPKLGAGYAGLTLAGADLVFALIFVSLAQRNTPSADEIEADAISREARTQIVESAASFAIMTPLARAVAGSGARSALLAAVASAWMARRRG